jgi:3-hydroxyisobutyrate dehydrogenase-like beta-hydroxyacid dehydrogenase
MAQAIGERGFDLHVWARRPQSLETLDGIPHTVHDSRASLAAGVGILALCLRDDRDIWDILAAPGMEESLRPGLAVVSHGTATRGRTGGSRPTSRRKASRTSTPPPAEEAPAPARTVTTMAGRRPRAHHLRS